ncbi:succinylglutamate-semialdehyde dehydrogenase [Pseudomaricurvus alkylphenolicus]|uniref:succinylglutamate-semialdehyde dehydrogenase n=1 Tax=Pseudomaricurvus alkylphenolicus TaxID=1306991 RepID=UPI00141E20A6|nr:succinylglutamate-semialdehyde dehydrogenase [Pseudomaricurvus alkylphenolicus]NIB41390.1 succinylglutamate-semialdehyde dehydrogenase [Pseudomaricurvus alkylphenolicus]
MNNNAQFIDGKWLTGNGEPLSSIDPASGDHVWQKNAADGEQVQLAVVAAKKAQSTWALTPLQQRIEIVERFARLLRDNSESLVRSISLETGKPDWEAATEVGAMANKAAISVRAQQERAGEIDKQHLRLRHRPHGVMAVFGPYNFPGHLPNGHIIPALLAGNTVVFKPSEQTPWVAEKTVELWHQAGLPAGVLNLVQGARAVGQALSQSPIDGLLFTGSSSTGKLLHQQMAERPEVLLALEMGGNNPLIVDADINIDAAVNIILQSAYLSAGQRCTCARRLVVIENAQTEALIEQLRSAATRIIVDRHDASPEPFMGPVINQQTATALLAKEANLREAGARVLASMQPQRANSNLLQPGLIDVTTLAQREDEEWFGPLLQVIRVADFDTAITEANNTRFGLAAGLISDNAEHQQRFCALIRAGVVSVNQPTAGASSEMPFGGVGASGNHRPSAYYAADYCAWPQAQSHGTNTTAQHTPLVRGIRV